MDLEGFRGMDQISVIEFRLEIVNGVHGMLRVRKAPDA
jgi:hypothetical protein